MNAIVLGRPVPILKTALSLALVTVASAAAAERDWTTIPADQQLLEQGSRAYNSGQCMDAVLYLYAYYQRNPPAIQESAEHRDKVRTALSACDRRLGSATSEGKYDDPNAKKAPPGTPGGLPPVELHAPKVGAKNGRCDIYASIATAQQRANLTQACKFAGGRWDTNYGVHFNWCLNQAASVVKSETAARQQLLEQCKP
ncbi:MAG TPA: hypothetical protein VFU71_01705 [Burkholderiaceae bacterium]|nr:hypothetical protein [Burkholderiaceae bacterium]